MRRDWLSTHVAAAVAAPFVLSLQPTEVAAINAEPAATTILAQAAGPGSAIPAPADAVPSATAPVNNVGAETATTTSASTGSSAPESANGAQNLDGATAPDGSEVTPPTPEGVMPFTPRGDDELPSEEMIENNPYSRSSATEGSQEGGVTSGGQEYGAFVPPTGTETTTLRGSEAGSEMLTILGEDVYNRRVNITTPPDTEVAEVVRLLAERANLNFVYAEGVIKGRVTLNLRDVPLGVALQSLLSSQELAIVREGANVMRIAPRQNVKSGLIDTRTIYVKLNWVPATAMATTLGTVIPAGTGGSVRPHAESNTLIITDTAPNVALLRDLVTQLDVPDKQVMIEARMVELIVSNQRSLGSQTRFERRDGSGNSPLNGVLSSNGPRTGNSTSVVNPDGSVTVTPGGALPANPVDAVISTFAGDPRAARFAFGGVVSILGAQFDVGGVLDALEDRAVVNTLASPRVITLNNQLANIDIQTEVPYFEAQQGVSQNVTAITAKFKDVGIRLEVLPTITNNGYVRMQLTPEQRIRAQDIPNPAGGTVPVVARRSAVTNVIVKDEDTVVLGGLRQLTASDVKSQIPWIGTVPILGWFFKSDAKIQEKTDLMLFVTPHIVKSPVLSPAENYKYSRVDAHWDLPDFFFDDSVDQREARHRFELDHNPRDYYPQTLKLPPPADVTAEQLNVTSEVTSETITTNGLGAVGEK